MNNYLILFREMISMRGLTEHTLTSYCTYIRVYLDYLHSILHKLPEEVSWEELREFLRWLQRSRSLSDRTVNGAISVLRFFTLYVLHQPWDNTQLPKRKFDTFHPFVPTRQQVFDFLSSMPDLKPKAMISLLYSSGLRSGEVRHLRYEDVSRAAMRIHIRYSKSRRDRYAILSDVALDLLTLYWRHYGRPRGFLFPKQRGEDKPIDSFYLTRCIRAHERRLGWEHQFTCHSFRHAFATHLYEDGTDLLTLQALLGHQSIRSSAIYVHLASNGIHSVVSPLDRLGALHD